MNAQFTPVQVIRDGDAWAVKTPHGAPLSFGRHGDAERYAAKMRTAYRREAMGGRKGGRRNHNRGMGKSND